MQNVYIALRRISAIRFIYYRSSMNDDDDDDDDDVNDDIYSTLTIRRWNRN